MANGWSRFTGLAQAVFGGAQLVDGRTSKDKAKAALGARTTVQGLGKLLGFTVPDEMADKVAAEMVAALDEKVAARTETGSARPAEARETGARGTETEASEEKPDGR